MTRVPVWRPLAFMVITLTMLFAAPVGNIFGQNERRDDVTALIDRNAVWDPAEFLLAKIKTHRIVMVADEGRGDPLYYGAVIGAINDWISKHEQTVAETGLPSKLFLFLEFDSTRAGAVERYFQNGDPVELIDPANFWGDQFTTGTLRFYAALRKIRRRIDAFNSGRAAGEQLGIEIVGPEKNIDLATWTTEKRENFFIHEREEYTSRRIKEVLDKAPDTKALVLYGAAHLLKGNLPKQAGNQKATGFYLAHYLSESFGGQGGVYICGQVDVTKSSWVDQAIVHVGRTFAVDHSIFTGVPVDGSASFQPFDGSIYYFAPPRYVRSITNVCSENLVNYIVSNIDAYKDSTKEFYRGKLDTWLYYLSTVAAVDWHPLDHGNARAVDSTVAAWKAWRQSSNLDVVEDISTLHYFRRSVDLIRTINQKQSTWHQIQIEKFVGFKVWFGEGASPQVRGDSIWASINRYRKPIVVDNLIQLLWVASPSEHEKAIEVLKRETGMDLSTAEEWTAWWETEARR